MKFLATAALMLLAACQSGGEGDGTLPGDAADSAPFADIAEGTLIRFAGTEPFWGGTIDGAMLTWSTPENIEGEKVQVSRFAGRGGLNFSGTLAGGALDMAITPGACSDGMSDQTYPFHATVTLGAQQLQGCAWREGDDLGVEAP